ncbi:hypothetical protein ACWCY6_41485 [Streptomyces sp. 900105755]|uniref:hypothetical protein n=1 Tax=Streptomyces sp. NPDC001507 TaxID=3364579 RepID=UPI00368F3A12
MDRLLDARWHVRGCDGHLGSVTGGSEVPGHRHGARVRGVVGLELGMIPSKPYGSRFELAVMARRPQAASTRWKKPVLTLHNAELDAANAALREALHQVDGNLASLLVTS